MKYNTKLFSNYIDSKTNNRKEKVSIVNNIPHNFVVSVHLSNSESSTNFFSILPIEINVSDIFIS